MAKPKKTTKVSAKVETETVAYGFNRSSLQVRIVYEVLMNRPIPEGTSYHDALDDLVRQFGYPKIRHLTNLVPDDSSKTDKELKAAIHEK